MAEAATSGGVRIAVDAMGGDRGPSEIVRGVILAARADTGGRSFILVGDREVLQRELSHHGLCPTCVDVRHASQIIEMDDKPRDVYRRKPDASVVVAARMVKDGEADAFISVGNTGAAMAAAIYLLRPIPGIDRPAIALPLPSRVGPVVLLDGGATVDCEPRQLLEFAVMGQAYARLVLKKTAPSVGLLSNGEEASKGNDLTKRAHVLLREHIPTFTGNVEGREVFLGKADVVVCDGFVGNVFLKAAEGIAELVLQAMKDELLGHRWMRMLLLPFRNAMRRLRGRLDYREFGGAPLLGVNGVCIIGHGRSDSTAIVNALGVAATSVANGLVAEIARSAETLHPLA